MMKKLFLCSLKKAAFAAMAVIVAACSGGSSVGDDAVEYCVDTLLSKMTLEEKIGQLNQESSFGSVEEMTPMIKEGMIGSLLNEVDPVRVNQLQRIAVEQSRLGIPILMSRDVIHGFRTIFPIPLGLAATFDPQLVEQGARVAAVEASSTGVRWTFSPMVDVSHDPRWGRCAEGSGEDPYLTSVMGVAMVKGYQGDSLSNPSSIAACAKHFAGYGMSESGLDYNSTYIPERQLRDVVLPPFEAVAKAGAATFMTSFNDIDGVPSTGNKFLVSDILRGEWGFNGFVVTDWNSAGEMLNHGFCADSAEVVMKSLAAGVDMDMMTHGYLRVLPQLVREGKVKESDVDNAVRNVLRLKFRLGLFDNPYVDETLAANTLYAPEHLEAAKQSALESAILLKNDNNVLPLSPAVKRVAVVGPMADAPHDQLGTWVFDGEKEHTVTPLAAIRELSAQGIVVNYAPGVAYSRDKSTAGIAQAVAAARNSDVVLAFMGEEAILSGEAHSLADINLKGAQKELVSALAKTGKPLVMVVMAGRPLTIADEVAQCDAVLYSFHPGTMGGPALADLIRGKANPSGKTPMTFPKMVGQCPIYYNHPNTGRPAAGTETLLDDIPLEAGQTSLGCTSFYMDAGFGPLFPFGYGLSYTTFEYSDIKLSANELKADDNLTVTFTLKNTGKVDGTEVAQLYVRDLAGSVARPVKELKRFERVALKAGEARSVAFTLSISELAFHGIDMERKVEAGDFHLWVAGDSQSGEPVSFKVVE